MLLGDDSQPGVPATWIVVAMAGVTTIGAAWMATLRFMERKDRRELKQLKLEFSMLVVRTAKREKELVDRSAACEADHKMTKESLDVVTAKAARQEGKIEELERNHASMKEQLESLQAILIGKVGK